MNAGGMVDDGGPAFARSPGVSSNGQQGMSLRDYFAGQAIQGMLSHPQVLSAMAQGPRGRTAELAYASYELADAMLAERDRRERAAS